MKRRQRHGHRAILPRRHEAFQAHSRRAMVSPPKAISTASRVSASASPSSSASAARVDLFLAPLGRPAGLPETPGRSRPGGCFQIVFSEDTGGGLRRGCPGRFPYIGILLRIRWDQGAGRFDGSSAAGGPFFCSHLQLYLGQLPRSFRYRGAPGGSFRPTERLLPQSRSQVVCSKLGSATLASIRCAAEVGCT